MKETDLSKLSLEELLKQEKTAKISYAFLLGTIIIQLAAGIFLTIKQGFSVFIILPIAFVPILIVNNTNLKKIRAEINLRGK
jgi:hypothetical protein